MTMTTSKTIGFMSKTALHVHHAFQYISLMCNHDVKPPSVTFYEGCGEHTSMKFPFSSGFNSRRNCLQLTNLCRSKLVKFERTQIHLQQCFHCRHHHRVQPFQLFASSLPYTFFWFQRGGEGGWLPTFFKEKCFV